MINIGNFKSKFKEIIQKARSKHNTDVLYIFLSLGIYALGNIIVRIIIGNFFDPDEMGIYTLFFIIYTFGFTFAAFGMGMTLTKYISEKKDNAYEVKKLITFGIGFSAITGILIGLIFFSLSKIIAVHLFHDENLTNLLRWFSLCLPIIAILQANLSILNGLLKTKKYFLVYLLLSVATAIITISTIFYFESSVYSYLLGFLISTLLSTILSLIFLRSYFISIRHLIKFKSKKFITFSAYVVLINSISFLNNQINSLLLASFLSVAEVGLLSAAVLIVQSLLLIPNAIQRITTPVISKKYATEDFQGIRNYVRKILFYEILIYAIIAIPIIIAGKPIITLLFSSDFILAYPVLVILTASSIIYSGVAAIGGALTAIERIKISFVLSIIVFAVNIIVTVLLVKYFGLIGAAFSTLIFYIFYPIIYYLAMKKYCII